MVPPMIPTMMIVIVVGAIVVGAIIVPARVVIIFRIVIPSIIGSVIPRSTTKGDTEALRFRIVLAYRQQSKNRQDEDKKSFHGVLLWLIRRNTQRPYSDGTHLRRQSP